MINLQNRIYDDGGFWSSQLVPITNWNDFAKLPGSRRPYWGWNEVPVARQIVTIRSNWDAVLIKLPASACDNSSTATLSCVADLNQMRYGLEAQLDLWYSAGYLVDGFPIVLAREWADPNDPASPSFPNLTLFKREFFCDDWEGDRYRIVSDPGAELSCYIERKA